MREQLLPLVGTLKKVCLTRSIPSEVRHNGFVHAVGRDWVLLQQLHDFSAEGYTALRIRDITDVRSGEHERHWERMLAAEGVLDQVASPGELPLDDIGALLRALQQREDNIIVECEDQEEAVEDFYLGQVLLVDNDAVHFASFDGMGRWDAAPHKIPLDEITKLQFDTPYAKTFAKYLEGPCPHG